MALQTSGPISLSQIRAEFGGSAPDSISEYYGADSGVPSSGTISFSDFYGKSDAPAISNIQSTYSGTVFEQFSSAGVSWLLRNRIAGGSGAAPSRGGWISFTGQGKYPAVWTNTENGADTYIATFNQRAYVGLAGAYAGTKNTANWTKYQMTADGGTDWLLYAAGFPYSNGAPETTYMDAVDTGGNNTTAKIDWYN